MAIVHFGASGPANSETTGATGGLEEAISPDFRSQLTTGATRYHLAARCSPAQNSSVLLYRAWLQAEW